MNMQIKGRIKVLIFRITILSAVSLIAVSCEKDKNIIEGPVDPPLGSRSEQTLDSIYYYAKQAYFWNDVIPDYQTFNPRQYNGQSNVLTSYEDALYAITQLKIDPATGNPYEFYGDGYPKYSYISDLTLANPAASSSRRKADVDLFGNGFDIGIRPVYYLNSNGPNSSYSLFITAVYPGSPAAQAGIKRGYLIKTVNGMEVGENYDLENSRVSAALKSDNVVLTGINFMDDVPFNVTLSKRSYKSSAVLASTVLTRSAKKIGYLSFSRFIELSDLRGNNDTDLDKVFADFNAAGVTDLIVDLRYNGGGYINTAEYLANLIAPTTVNGKKMYTEVFNQNLQRGEKSILKNQPLLDDNGKVQTRNGRIVTYADLDYSQDAAENNAYFSKRKGLNNVTNIVFIVTANTASASEMLINSLKPYMNVKMVGNVTYGKPIGFFPLVLENRYELYMSMFETKNSQNEGGYFSGMRPDVLSEFDDPRYDFGNEKENYMALALEALVPMGSTSRQAATMNIRGREVNLKTFRATQSRTADPGNEFIGMIDRRTKLKK